MFQSLIDNELYKIQACLAFIVDGNATVGTKICSYLGIKISKICVQTAFGNIDVCFTWVAEVLMDLDGSYFHDIACIFTLFLKIHCHRKWLENTLILTKQESPTMGLQ